MVLEQDFEPEKTSISKTSNCQSFHFHFFWTQDFLIWKLDLSNNSNKLSKKSAVFLNFFSTRYILSEHYTHGLPVR